MIILEEKVDKNGYLIRKGTREASAEQDKTIVYPSPQIEVQTEQAETQENKKWWQFWKRGK